MDSSKTLRIVLTILVIGLIAGAFFLGRSKAKIIEKTKIKYVPAEPIHDTIPNPVPYIVIEPVDTFNLFKEVLEAGLYSDLFPKDSIWIYPTREDTLRILKDYLAEKYYHEVLFEVDTLGKCSIDATVHMNRIKDLSYDYTPVAKVITNEVKFKPLLEPFIGIGGGYLGTARIQVGAFFSDDWGFSIDYERQFITQQNNYSVMILKKF